MQLGLCVGVCVLILAIPRSHSAHKSDPFITNLFMLPTPFFVCVCVFCPQADQAGGPVRLPLPHSHGNSRRWLLTSVTLSTLGVLLVCFSKMAHVRVWWGTSTSHCTGGLLSLEWAQGFLFMQLCASGLFYFIYVLLSLLSFYVLLK